MAAHASYANLSAIVSGARICKGERILKLSQPDRLRKEMMAREAFLLDRTAVHS